MSHFTLLFSACQAVKLRKVNLCILAQKEGLKIVFYDRYVELCKRNGVSPTTAALEMGLSKATPTKWKRDKSTPSGKTLKVIADYFGVTTMELLDESTVETRSQLRDSFAYRTLFDTLPGATDADLLEAAALIARRKEERNIK